MKKSKVFQLEEPVATRVCSHGVLDATVLKAGVLPSGLIVLLSLLFSLGLFLFLSVSPAFGMFRGFDPEEVPCPGGKESCGEAEIRSFPLGGGQSIVVDGRLDDPAWLEAKGGTGFRVWDPDRGARPCEQTVFKVAHDHDAVYFAVACREGDPGRIRKLLSRRDNPTGSDLVSIYIDPYHDLTTGYNFRVNPLGVQQDAYVYNDGDRDEDWDAVWEVETYEDSEGWYAEFRIPFSSIRYRPDGDTWGLQVFRYMHGRGEDTAWVTWGREAPGFVSRFGRLTGLEGVPPPRQLELAPYTVLRATDPAANGPEEVDHFKNFGLDLKYGITADLTLNATIQPDFGQVEADPAVLNLTANEVYFQEKRPFFVEGSRFYQHRAFDMFYSRRIGTGSENSRIRYATKLTGKTAGSVSMAALFAETDLTEPGQAHNFTRRGMRTTRYAVGRFGKEFSQGRHFINLMQTAVVRSASRAEAGDYGSREAYTTGLDWKLNTRDRRYSLSGSLAGSVVDPEALPGGSDPGPIYGTGGYLELYRHAGTIRGNLFGRWETDRLDLNDIGFMGAGDRTVMGAWIQYQYTPQDQTGLFNRGNLNFNLHRSWLYSSRSGRDLHQGGRVWSYDRGHPQWFNMNVNGWLRFHSFAEVRFGSIFNMWGTQRFDTRSTYLREDGSRASIPGGGPLIGEPATYGGWIGFNTDSRRNLVFELEERYYIDVADNVSWDNSCGLRWNPSSRLQNRLHLSHNYRTDDTQHLENYETPGEGIGGISYVYGDLVQQTVDATLRTSYLFSRSKSLELYLQPYITIGDYQRTRRLVRADSYDLEAYSHECLTPEAFDFRYTSVNLNAVYRWEYRPGSTLYVVWTQSREGYAERRYEDSFQNPLGASGLLRDEPENVFLVKLSYWLPI